MGFMQLDQSIAGYRAMGPGLAHSVGVEAIPYLLVILT